MDNNGRIILEGRFRKEMTTVEKVVVTLASVFLLSPFAIVIFNIISSITTSNIIAGICVVVAAVGLLGFFFKKGLSLGIYKIVLYEDKISLKDNLSANLYSYDDVIKVYSITHSLYVETKTKKYEFHHLENSREITDLILRKRNGEEPILNPIQKPIQKPIQSQSSYSNEKVGLYDDYMQKKSSNDLIIAVKIIVVLVFFFFVFAITSSLGGKSFSDVVETNKILIYAFGSIPIFFVLLAVFILKWGKKANGEYKKAKQLYWDDMALSAMNNDLPAKTERVITLSPRDRLVIYKTETRAYKCSHETFEFKRKKWYSYMLSDSYQTIYEMEEYVEEFRRNFKAG